MRPWQQALIDNPPQLDYGTDPVGQFGPPPAQRPVVPPPEAAVAPVARPSFAPAARTGGFQRPPMQAAPTTLQRPMPGATPQSHYQRLVGQKVLERLFGMQATPSYNGAQGTRMTLQDLIEMLRRR